MMNRQFVKNLLKKREKDTHKGDYGKVLIIAGSRNMTGAAVLCARGALRAGSGLVYISSDESLFPIFQVAEPEAICIERYADIDFNIYDSIVFGPGIGMDDKEKHRDLLSIILKEYQGNLLIDADGLNTIAYFDMYDEIKSSEAYISITPHEGEAARLLESYPDDRMETSELLKERTGAVCVLKGTGTVVAGKRKSVNESGNPGMATAGSGDVLAGVIASLAGQGYDMESACRAGVYIHGLAGDISAKKLGQWGITATDIANSISLAIKDVLGE